MSALHEAMIDLTQALLNPPGHIDPDRCGVAIVGSSRMLMASLSLDTQGVRMLSRDDVAAILRQLAAVVDRTNAPVSAVMMTHLAALTSATAIAVKGGAR